MQHDVLDLKTFYYNRALGRVAQRILRDHMLDHWPSEQTAGMTIAGYGFAAPLLRPYLNKARRVTALMPAHQGVMGWPHGLPNHSVLSEETAWPLDTGSVDRLVMLHALELADQPMGMLAEAWRVLGPGGRMLIMVSNRTGLWARSEATPFGVGRSYTMSQLASQAEKAGFVAERTAQALYIPPSDRRFWLRSAQMWENAGSRISRMLVAGILIAEFTKQVPASIGRGSRVKVPSPLKVLGGIARPIPAGEGALRHDVSPR